MSPLADIKGILFDKDGTLIDLTASWLPPIRQAAELVAARARQPELAEQLLVAGGFSPQSASWATDSIIAFGSSEAMLERWSELTDQPLIDSLLPEIREIVLHSLANAVPIVADLSGLLSSLETRFTLGVASMDDEINVRQTLTGLGIQPHLQFYCGADSGYGHKPGPGMVHAFCRCCGLVPSQVAVVGDGRPDLEMARAAGALAIGVLSGGSSKQSLARHADILLEDISVLGEIYPG